LNLPEKLAGTVGRCKHCNGRVEVPIPTIIAPEPKHDFYDHISACLDAAKRGAPYDHGYVQPDSSRVLGAGKTGKLLAIAVILVVIVILGGFLASRMRRSEESQNKYKTQECRNAFIAAQEAVKGKIKYPSTVKFPSFEVSSVLGPYANGAYMVSGYCDTQNETGMAIRTNYRCTMRFREGKWQCDFIGLIDR
jgi:hypothetical protein